MVIGKEIKDISDCIGSERVNIADLDFVDKSDKKVYSISSTASFPTADIYVDRLMIMRPEAVLCIHGGTRFFFSESAGMICYCVIKAEGSKEKRIFFGPSNRTWGNIHIATHMASGSSLDYCDITGGMGLKDFPTNQNLHQREECFLGGGLMVSEADVSISNCNIYQNNSDLGGGAYFFNSRSSLSAVSFDANNGNYGAGVYADESSLMISGLSVERCVAVCGGGIFLSRDKSELRDSSIRLNQARKDGGGVCLEDMSCTLFMQNNEISSNHAENGGGVHSYNSNFSANRLKLNSNMADFGGGAYLSASEAEIEESTIEENRAENCGGGIYSDHSQISANDSGFIKNHAKRFGGGAYIYGHEMSMRNCSVEKNKAESGQDIFLRFSMLKCAESNISKDRIQSENSVAYFSEQ